MKAFLVSLGICLLGLWGDEGNQQLLKGGRSLANDRNARAILQFGF